MPLSKKSILITRSKNESSNLCNRLISLGAECYSLPMIDIEYNNNHLTNLDNYKTVLLCSPNGVNAFVKEIEDLRILGNIKIGVVGKSTFNRLKQYKINADFYPSKFLVE